MTLSRPSGDRSRFDGLMSRWMTPLLVGVLQGVGHVGDHAGHRVEVAAARAERGRTQLRRRDPPHGRPRRRARSDTSSGGQRGGRLGRPVPAARLLGLPEDLVERRPVDQLHGVEVRAVLLAGGVDRHDVGVVQLGRRLGLAAEALHGVGGQAQPAAEDLEGHLAVERDLARLVDDAHAAAADLADDLEVAEPLPARRTANHRGHRSALHTSRVLSIQPACLRPAWPHGPRSARPSPTTRAPQSACHTVYRCPSGKRYQLLRSGPAA